MNNCAVNNNSLIAKANGKMLAVLLCLLVSVIVSAPICNAQQSKTAARKSTETVVVYVSPSGNDAFSGRSPERRMSDGPLASMTGARNAVRRLRASQHPPGTVEVIFAGGTYKLNAPVTFGPLDSGQPSAPVRFEAAKGARPIFIGGELLHDWSPSASGSWKTFVPSASRTAGRFEQLWVDGKLCTRARSPNQGYFTLSQATTVDEDHCLPGWFDWLYPKVNNRLKPEHQLAFYEFRQGLTRMMDEGKKSFKAEPAQLQLLKRLTASDLHDTVAVIYHSWEISRLRIAEIDPQTSTVKLAGSSQWDFCKWAPRQHFRLENFKQAMDEPGEWFLERSGWISYIPRAGENMRDVAVVAPRLNELVRIQGTPSNPVHDIQFDGLSFQYSGYTMPESGTSDPVSETSVPAAITADFSQNIRFSRCDIAHIGSHAMWFRSGCQDCSVEQSYLHDLGAGGIRIGETTDPADAKEITRHISVIDNKIDQVGKIHAGANAVWIGESSDNVISHNEIAHTAYSGISVGAKWGYADSLAKHNEISHNHIHDIGNGELNDLGGVYIVGRCENSLLSDNVIHAVHSNDDYSRGAWAIYNDEGCSNVTVTRNLCFDTSAGGYCINFGNHNNVTNNIFALGKKSQFERNQPDDNVPFIFEHNIIYWTKGDPLFKKWLDDRPCMDHNIYWQTSGNKITMAGMTWQQWQKSGHDRSSLIANPEFVDALHGDFRLSRTSPALKVGFHPFDLASCGPRPGHLPPQTAQFAAATAPMRTISCR